MAMLDYFFETGGNWIDTASNYQAEQSEQWIGEWLTSRGVRDQMVIATKYTTAFQAYKGFGGQQHSTTVGNGSKSMRLSVEASLKKLQTSYIDILYIHWWDYTSTIEEVMLSLNDLVTSGKVLYLGISDTPAWIVSKANQYARDHGLRPFVVYQGRWSAADRDMERDIIPMCQAEGMGIAPWGSLGGGNFKSEEQRQKDAGRKMNPPSEKQKALSAALERVGKRKNTEITSIALAYVMHKAPYVFPIVGGRKIEHLKGNIEALGIELTEEDIEEIEATVDFDAGFPMNFLSRRKGGPRGPEDIWLSQMAGHFDYVDHVKVGACGLRAVGETC